MRARWRFALVATACAVAAAACGACGKKTRAVAPQDGGRAVAPQDSALAGAATTALDAAPELPPPQGAGEEVEITFRFESPYLARAEEHTVQAKGDRVRIVLPPPVPDAPRAAPEIGLFDTGTRVLYKRRDAERTFLAVEPIAGPAGYDAGTWSVTKTGERGAALGRECEVWKLARGAWRATACTVPDIALFDFSRLHRKLRLTCYDELVARRLFPLRIEEYDETGDLSLRMVAIRLTPKDLPDDDFAIPAGYRRVRGIPPGPLRR